jgi:hypothetical protein
VQFSTIPTAIVDSLFRLKVFDVHFSCVPSPGLAVGNIVGAGVRLSSSSFALTATGPDDAVYFSIVYTIPRITTTSPCVQFQIAYTDQVGRRLVRLSTVYFSLTNTIHTSHLHVDFDVFMATAVHEALEKCRETGALSSAHESLNATRRSYYDDTFAKLFLIGRDRLTVGMVCQIMLKAEKTITRLTVPNIMGTTPADVVLFLAPVAFEMGPEGTQGPFLLSGRKGTKGTLYIRIGGGRALILGAVGLRKVEGCTESVVEILEEGHPLYDHVMNCIGEGK